MTPFYHLIALLHEGRLWSAASSSLRCLRWHGKNIDEILSYLESPEEQGFIRTLIQEADARFPGGVVSAFVQATPIGPVWEWHDFYLWRETMVRHLVRHGARAPSKESITSLLSTQGCHDDPLTMATLCALDARGREGLEEMGSLARLRLALYGKDKPLADILAEYPATLLGLPIEEVVCLLGLFEWSNRRRGVERNDDAPCHDDYVEDMAWLGQHRISPSTPVSTQVTWALTLGDYWGFGPSILGLPPSISPPHRELFRQIGIHAKGLLPTLRCRRRALDQLTGHRHPWARHLGWVASGHGMACLHEPEFACARSPLPALPLGQEGKEEHDSLKHAWDIERERSIMLTSMPTDPGEAVGILERWHALLGEGWSPQLWCNWPPEDTVRLVVQYVIAGAITYRAGGCNHARGQHELLDMLDRQWSQPSPTSSEPLYAAILRHAVAMVPTSGRGHTMAMPTVIGITDELRARHEDSVMRQDLPAGSHLPATRVRV